MEYPLHDDCLFKEESNISKGAWVANPANKFFLYSEGYKEAGLRLFEYCSEHHFYNNMLVYPLIYNFRQFLELRLKELIIMGNRYVSTGEDFPDEHSLVKLWNIYRKKLLPQIDNTLELSLLDNVERLLNEFHKIDPQSMSFRYPVTKAPNRGKSINMTTIDIENFKNTMDRLSNFFDSQWDMISHYQDLKDELLSDMY